MDLQHLFYLMGIIFMSLGVILLIGIIILLFFIKNKVGELQRFIELRINEIASVTLKPVRKAAHAAQAMLTPSRRKR